MSEKTKIDSLTGLRAIAATMVVLGHICDYNILGSWWIIKYGWAGVNIFFVLSGFLFTYLYLDKFTERKQNLKEFFLKRVFRIYPLYLFLLCITIFSRWGRYSIWDILSHLTLTHAFFKEFKESINIPAWTLSTEEFFYLTIPITLYILGNIYNSIFQESKVKKIITIFVVYVIATNAGLELVNFILKIQTQLLNFDYTYYGLYSATVLGRFKDFGLGIFLGFLVLKFPESRFLKSRVYSNLMFILGVLIFFGISYLQEFYIWFPNLRKEIIVSYAQSSYCWSAFFIILSLCGNSVFNRLFSLKPMVYLGQISFALYIFHYLNFAEYNDLASFVKFILKISFASEQWAVIVTMVLMNLGAALLFHLLEEPVQSYLRKKFIKPI